eukprot:CAMPEP_0204076164 /NCGR_PEP_ID=MMETSP0360-20130528/167449_1 /ASSEMBLY_ACC=CAM_ASM_000342 /TAXON_ID=268821 /ORGANISM="Scrippsiella Hangoei, Strain SHTV-5" /LENGTH=122 /DNA_ID=CAMNT_0051024697 /DNA_START=158 /DNA_END=526 /DNA_ORIENTATION=+
MTRSPVSRSTFRILGDCWNFWSTEWKATEHTILSHNSPQKFCTFRPNALTSGGHAESQISTYVAQSPIAAALHIMMAFSEKAHDTRRCRGGNSTAQSSAGTSKSKGSAVWSKKFEKHATSPM